MAKNISTTNRTSNKRGLYANQEFASYKYTLFFISFFAEVLSETDGDEFINHATELFDTINAKYPEFIEETAKMGIYLTQSWPYEEDFGGENFLWKDIHSFALYWLIIKNTKLAQKCKPVGLSITYGSGDSIPLEYLDFRVDQSIKLCFEYKFKSGDILYIDKYQSYHGRTIYDTQHRDVSESFLDDIPENKKFPGYIKKGSI